MPRFDKLLVLDLDETLLHAADSEDAVGRLADHRLFDYPLYRRPHVDAFLAWARERASMVRSPNGDAHVTSGRST